MRLLNVATLAFEEFVGKVGHGIPLYAILSHTWAAEEVSFMDHITQRNQHKRGYEKIKNFCQLAESEGFQYAWVDTCCINSTSSAELSEAINSMFQWYRDAVVCYAYLEDVDSAEDPSKQSSSFASARWFTRGWTLQELLAPKEVVFLGSDWVEIGTKKSLLATLSVITRVSEKVLEECRWSEYSVAQKMSWAAGRHTTRPEDEAYCLLGLFDVNMPLLYGEGRKAFSRLQQEILKVSEDQSIFAWSYPEQTHSHVQLSGLLAASPEQFRNSSEIEVLEHDGEYESPFEVVNRLFRIRLRLVENVTAMKLQVHHSDPALSEVVEILHNEGTESYTFINYTEPFRLRIEGEEAENEETNTQVAPIIVIEGADGGSGVVPKEPEEDLKLTRHATYPKSIATDTKAGSTSELERWVWYTYEPVLIAPLKCHLRGTQLGVLLSRGSVEHAGLKVLSRLHNPSIVALRDVLQSQFTALVTTYASMSSAAPSVLTLYDDALGPERFSWPEIRIAGAISAGYLLMGECGPNWSLGDPRKILTQSRRFQDERDMVECSPLAVFSHESGNETLHPTFFLTISHYSKTNSICPVYVGRPRAGALELMLLDYKLFFYDLGVKRRAAVPLGNEQALVIKLRESTTITFISVSIEATKGLEIREEGILTDPAKIGRLNSRLFPILRTLQKHHSALRSS